MATLDSFRPFVALEVPDCPTALMDAAMIEAARIFCFDTWLLRTDATVNTVVSQQSYTLSPASGTEVFAIRTVAQDDMTPLVPLDDPATARFSTTAGTPTRYWATTNTLHFYPIPDEVIAFNVEQVIRPTKAATTLPDSLSEFSEAVAAYARFKLMSMVNKPWSNSEGAALALKRYVDLSSRDRITNNRSLTRAAVTVASRPFA